jgi:hypothetical protein
MSVPPIITVPDRPIPASTAKYNWIMHGKTVDNVNEALAPTSDINTSNVTYLREDYTVKVASHYTEDNVVPLVDAEYGYALHTITVGDHSEVIYIDSNSGVEAQSKIKLLANTYIRSSGCIYNSDTKPVFRIFAVATEKVVNGVISDANILFFDVRDFGKLFPLTQNVITPLQTCSLASLIADAVTGSNYHFSTQLVPVDRSKICSIRNAGFSIQSKTPANCQKAILVGVSSAQKWDLDMRNSKNNDISLEATGGLAAVPRSLNDPVYDDTQTIVSSTVYAGLKWISDTYKQGKFATTTSKGVRNVTTTKDTKTTSTLYNYIKKGGIEKTEFGHLLCIDATFTGSTTSTSGPVVYANIGNRVWSIRTAPEIASSSEDGDTACGGCYDTKENILDETYFLQKDIFTTVGGSDKKKQTHLLITNVMKEHNVAIGFDTDTKRPEHCRIYPGDLSQLSSTNPTNDSTYVAWIRKFVKADRNTQYSTQNSNIAFFSPSGSADANNSIDQLVQNITQTVEIIDKTIITYARDEVGNYTYRGGESSEVLIFAKLSDVLNPWDATKMAGQGAGRSDLKTLLNSPFDNSFRLKSNVTIETSLSYETEGSPLRFQVTDMFADGLFVFCYVNNADNLSDSELNALNFRGAGVTGMPVIDVDDGSVKFGTGKFNQIPMDQIFLENCEKLRKIPVTADYWCFDASNYCGYHSAGSINSGKSKSTLCNIDNLALNKEYNQLTLGNVFTGGDASVYNTNIAAQSARALKFYYNSICSAKLNQSTAIYKPSIETDLRKEISPSNAKGIRIWETLTKTNALFNTFNLDSDNANTDDDHKRIPIANINGNVALTYPQYHEITSGAHIHYNIANQSSITGRSTNYVSVFTKGGCVGFYESTTLKTSAVFMCAVPLVDDATNKLSVGTGGIGGVKFGTVADQFFVYALCPNLAGLSLATNDKPPISMASASVNVAGGSTLTDPSKVIVYDQSYIIAYDLNAISAPPAGVPSYTVIDGTNIYSNSKSAPYIVAYLADTGRQYLAGNLTAVNNLLIVPTGSYSTYSVVRLYRKTDIVRSNSNGALDAESGFIWAPIFDLLPAYQIPYCARSVTGVAVSGNSIFIQGGVSPSTTANFKNSIGVNELSNTFRTFTLEL